MQADGKALLLKTSDDGYSCLHLASKEGHVEVVEVQVQADSEVLLLNTSAEGASCLHLASQVLVWAGGLPLLLKFSEDGRLCLDSASHKGHVKIFKVLVQAGDEALLLKTSAN